jgi:hypothetical protein
MIFITSGIIANNNRLTREEEIIKYIGMNVDWLSIGKKS